jgi:hypothetical protein
MGLGRNQLKLLMAMGSPSMLLMTPCTGEAKSLERRGLIDRYNGGEARRITPAGMRALADAYEAGELEQFMHKPATPTEAGETKEG